MPCPPWPLTVPGVRQLTVMWWPHDGFHILSPERMLTHTNQYIAPPVPPDFQLVGGWAVRKESSIKVKRRFVQVVRVARPVTTLHREEGAGTMV